jgi:hypothetical protein
MKGYTRFAAMVATSTVVMYILWIFQCGYLCRQCASICDVMVARAQPSHHCGCLVDAGDDSAPFYLGLTHTIRLYFCDEVKDGLSATPFRLLSISYQ